MTRFKRWALAWLSAFSLVLTLFLGAGPAFAQGMSPADQGGSLGLNFGSTTATVTRVYGDTRMSTAMAIAELEFPNGVPSQTAILTAGNNRNLVDALLAAPLAKALDVPILLTPDGQTPGNDLPNYLQTLNVNKVILVGTDNNSTLSSQLPSGVTVAAGYGDSNPYDTAAAVAGALQSATGQSSFSTLFLASGNPGNWIDALSASPAAAKDQAPIILAPNPEGGNTYLPQSILQYVYTGSPTVYQLGILAHADVVNMPTSATAIPLFGQSRFGTSLAINEQFFPHPTTVFIANGDNAHLVDALTAAPLAASENAPILIINGATITPSGQEYLRQVEASATSYVIIGGGASIPQTVTQELEQEQHAKRVTEFFWQNTGWYYNGPAPAPLPMPQPTPPPPPPPTNSMPPVPPVSSQPTPLPPVPTPQSGGGNPFGFGPGGPGNFQQYLLQYFRYFLHHHNFGGHGDQGEQGD
ncbi:MAG: cell wall-binding repeat-containing protein [Firmicutes bacterium]|nr:cell wall-binding repeat-containing protein [Bacillota bacterium]